MLRYFLQQVDFADAANVGGPVEVTFKAIDGDASAVEAWLLDKRQWRRREVLSVSIADDDNPEANLHDGQE